MRVTLTVRGAIALSFLIGLLALCLGKTAWAGASYEPGTLFGHRVEYFIDHDAAMGIEQVTNPESSISWQPSHQASPSFGFIDGAVWLRFKVDEVIDTDSTWVLEISYPPLDDIRFYAPSSEGYHPVITGDSYPYAQRELPTYNYAFLLRGDQKRTEYYYLRVQTQGSLVIPIILAPFKEYLLSQAQGLLIYGTYAGIACAMILYNFYLLLAFRERIYLLYSLYVIAFSLYQLTINGITQSYLWPSAPFINTFAAPFFTSMTIVILTIFSITLMQTRHYLPRFTKWLYAVVGMGVLGALISLTADYSFAMKFVTGVVFIDSLSLLIASFATYFQGYKSARFYIYAFTLFLFGCFIFSIKTFGYIPHNIFTHNAVQIGSAFEMILLALALSDRIHFKNLSISQEIKRMNEELTVKSAEIERVFIEQTREIKKILENVQVSFLIVNKELMVKNGFSNSARSIFKNISAGVNLMDLVTASEPEKSLFKQELRAMFDRALPPSRAAGTSVQRLTLQDCVIDVVMAPVKDDNNSVSGVLLSITDATYAMKLERKVKGNRAIVNILQHLGMFCGAMGSALATFAGAARAPRTQNAQISAYLTGIDRYLKGFEVDLLDVLTHRENKWEMSIHEVTWRATLLLQSFLKDHQKIMHLRNPEQLSTQFAIYERELRDLEDNAELSGAYLLEWANHHLMQTASFYFGALNLVVIQSSKKYGKRFELCLNDAHRVQYHPVFEILVIHLANVLDAMIRNSHYVIPRSPSTADNIASIGLTVHEKDNTAVVAINCNRLVCDIAKLDQLQALAGDIARFRGTATIETDPLDGLTPADRGALCREY
jgi:hypothetical protein